MTVRPQDAARRQARFKIESEPDWLTEPRQPRDEFSLDEILIGSGEVLIASGSISRPVTISPSGSSHPYRITFSPSKSGHVYGIEPGQGVTLTYAEGRLHERSTFDAKARELARELEALGLEIRQRLETIRSKLIHAKQSESRESFVPSDELVDFVERGMAAIAEAAAEGQSHEFADAGEKSTRAELQKMIATKLERVLGTLGRRAGARGEKSVRISQGRSSFSPLMQFQILDRILVLPADSGDFLSRLHDELVSFVREGGRLAGNWGATVEKDDELYMLIAPPRSVPSEDWEAVSAIEGDIKRSSE